MPTNQNNLKDSSPDKSFVVKGPSNRSRTVLTIAGSDCSAGAGLQADLKTFAAMGVYGYSVVTAITAQSYKRLDVIESVSADLIRRQLVSVLEQGPIDAVKLGMLGSESVAEIVVGFLQEINCPIVIDPVLSASVGGKLWQGGADFYREQLLPLATLLTPNIAEAAKLLSVDTVAASHEEYERQARALVALGPTSVLLKGGHSQDRRLSTDYLAISIGDEMPIQAFSAARLETPHGHGTGCTLASAIAAALAQGLDIAQAIAVAKNYLQASLMAAGYLNLVPSNGPLHHFSNFW